MRKPDKSPSTCISRADFLKHVAILYRAMNYADSDDERKAAWMPASMAGRAGCGHLDALLHDLVAVGAIGADTMQAFHDNL